MDALPIKLLAHHYLDREFDRVPPNNNASLLRVAATKYLRLR
jgi:hypothetical protein